MIFWVREIAGWLLVALGLATFAVVYGLFVNFNLFAGIPMMVIGIFVFRGGIHLLKVAVAARVCREAQDRLYPDPTLGAAPLPAARSAGRASWRS